MTTSAAGVLNATSISVGTTAQEIIDIALSNAALGIPWAADGCAAFVWGITNLAGLPFFDLEDKTINNDPKSPQDADYIVPHSVGIKSGTADVSGDGWYVAGNTPSVAQLVSVLQPGDVVRVYKAGNTTEDSIDADGHAIAHSFVVVSNIGGNIQVVDNWNGTTISEHSLSDITNSWAPDGQFAAAFVSRIDSNWVANNVSQNTFSGDAYGDWSTLNLATLIPTPIGDEFQVNTYTFGAQYGSSIAALKDGGFLVTWTSFYEDSSGGGTGIYGQRYDATGAPDGGEFRVNSVTEGSQSNSSVAALTDGGFVVTWTTPDSVNTNTDDIHAQLYDKNGAPVGTEFLVNSYTTSEQNDCHVAGLANGGFVVTWSSYVQPGDTFDYHNYEIRSQLYNANGLAVSGEFQVNSDNGYDSAPRIAALTNGGFVETWESIALDSNNADTSIALSGQLYSSAGVANGGEFTIAQLDPHTSGGFQSPQVTALSGGGFVVTWASTDASANVLGVFGQRYDASGIPAGGSFMATDFAAESPPLPFVFNNAAALTDGGFVITWEDRTTSTLYGRTFDANSIALSEPFIIKSNESISSTGAQVAGLANDSFVATW